MYDKFSVLTLKNQNSALTLFFMFYYFTNYITQLFYALAFHTQSVSWIKGPFWPLLNQASFLGSWNSVENWFIFILVGQFLILPRLYVKKWCLILKIVEKRLKNNLLASLVLIRNRLCTYLVFFTIGLYQYWFFSNFTHLIFTTSVSVGRSVVGLARVCLRTKEREG